MRPTPAILPALFALLEIPSCAGQAPVVGFADKDPTLSSRSSIATLALTVSRGETSILLKTAAIRTQDGINIVPEAISFPSTPTKLTAGQSVPISINADPLRLNRQGAYPVTINVMDGAGKPLNPAQLAFRYIVPEVNVQIGSGAPILWTITRPAPWAVAQNTRSYELRTVPSDAPLEALRGTRADLFIGSDKGMESPDGAKISDVAIDRNARSLSATVTVPQGKKELSGSLRIDGPSLKQELVQPVIVRVKDFWLFPLLVIAAGYTLSFLTTDWNTRKQQELLNQIRKRQIAQGIDDLIDGSGRNRQDFNEVLRLLQAADLRTAVGDVTGARDQLQLAAQSLDDVRTTPASQGPAAFSVTRSNTDGEQKIAARIRHGNFWMACLGIALTILLAFVAIWQRDSFSGLSDYVVAFLGAFGIDQSIKGLAPILNRLRGAA